MALNVPQGLQKTSGGIPGFCTYRYDSMDAGTLVDASGYFNNADDDLNLAVGDMIDCIDWTTAIGAGGTIALVTKHIVVSVSAAGVVDLSNNLTAATAFTDSD